MNWKFFLLSVCAVALLAPQSRATPLDITLTAATLSGAPGDAVTFDGTLANNTGLDLNVNSAVINIGTFAPEDIDLTDFIINFTGLLSDGNSIGPADLFTIAIPDPFPTGSYAGELTIQGGADENAALDLATVDFEVDVTPAGTTPPPALTPEPNTVILVVPLAILLLWRRASSLRHE